MKKTPSEGSHTRTTNPVPIPVEIYTVLGVYFSDKSGNDLSYPSRGAFLLIDF